MWDKLEKLLYSGVYGYTYMHTFILISYMHRAFYKVLFTYRRRINERSEEDTELV